MTSRIYLVLISLLVSGAGLSGQVFTDTEEEYDSLYAVRIQQEEIDGVYIPRDIEDSYAELRRLSSPEDLQVFADAPEEVVAEKLHFGLGRWIIYNWGFYEGSRLSHQLKLMGLEHPDDMARFLIVGFHRDLNGEEQEYEERIAHYAAMREKLREEREAKKEVIHEEKRIRKNEK